MIEPQHFPDLISGAWRALPFVPFREGVDVHYLWQGAANQPVWALLRYQPGASVPEHLHAGLETIIVLKGSQSDDRGTYQVGSVICNPEGSRHRVWSDEGCIVLIQWQRPVSIL